jgi:tRNA modification GTPase
VESLGVAKSRKVLEQADLILGLFDAATPWTPEDEEIVQTIGQKPTFFLLNKIDLPVQLTLTDIRARCPQADRIFQISITEHRGIDELKQALVDYVITVPLESVEVTNSRHKQALTLTRQALAHARQSAESDMSQEFIALDLREALDQAGRITGEATTDDILDDIFSMFCIGK